MAKNDNKNSENQTETTEIRIEAAVEESTKGLVKMRKDGEHLHVHPTTVKAHEDAGWKLA